MKKTKKKKSDMTTTRRFQKSMMFHSAELLEYHSSLGLGNTSCRRNVRLTIGGHKSLCEVSTWLNAAQDNNGNEWLNWQQLLDRAAHADRRNRKSNMSQREARPTVDENQTLSRGAHDMKVPEGFFFSSTETLGVSQSAP